MSRGKNDKKSNTFLVSFWKAIKLKCTLTGGMQVCVIPTAPIATEEGEQLLKEAAKAAHR